ncbi:MAG TPA: FliA/WhiG family RNA polymerase sigma factor [Anaerohalosphaeraceae bacterium]|nr:FliA/WhiG family RNA polymerase sigma factor [Anaerohalosphaeraceae bacterium]HOL87711.1 FliA/WhiG family RNA polymerase sigma factor [Anaerohalosphaeraceae bacterium]HPP55782.1 FliA/WhiG family RNA polymerase sigma factor [Anaerohalosphaeraceae bacterium]
MESGGDKLSQLWQQYFQTGDVHIRNQIFMHYLPEIRYAAERLAARLPRCVQMEDLLGAGAVGLIKAIERFDPSRNIKFETYCAFRIQGAMLDMIRKSDFFGRLTRRKARRYHNALQKLEAVLGRPPTDEELAAELKMNLSEFYDYLKEVNTVHLLSLSREFAGSDGQSDFSELSGITDTKSPDPVLQAQIRDLREYLKNGFSGLEGAILSMYYLEGLTMKEIGIALGISESRVCQIHSSVYARLCDRLHRKSCYDNLHPGSGFQES